MLSGQQAFSANPENRESEEAGVSQAATADSAKSAGTGKRNESVAASCGRQSRSGGSHHRSKAKFDFTPYIDDSCGCSTVNHVGKCFRCNCDIRLKIRSQYCFRCHRLMRPPSLEQILNEGINYPDFSLWIYFVEAVGLDFVKVGLTASSDVTSRLKGIQTGCPVPVQLMAAIPGDTATERAIHKHFASDRSVGEWFGRSEAINTFIDQVKNIARTDKDAA